VVHGGLPRNGEVTYEEIDAIHRFRQIPMPELAQPEEDEIFQDLMWSDPMENIGWVESDRGVGAMFGPDVTKAFLKTNGLELVIRSHEECNKGHEIHHNGKLMTIFSASNYDGPNSNMGATVTLMGDSAEYSIWTYSVVEDDFLNDHKENTMGGGGNWGDNTSVAQTPQGAFGISRTFSAASLGATFVGAYRDGQEKERFGHFCASLLGNINLLAMARGNNVLQQMHNERRTRDDVVHEIRDRIYERRHRLLAYFTKIDRTQKGSVWKMEWVETMHVVLNLDLPWFFLRPSFTHTEPISHRIRYVSFLSRFKNGIADLWLPIWRISAMAELYYTLFGRKRHPVAKVLSDREDPIGYNEFCGLVRQVSESNSDNELFHLYLALCNDGQYDTFLTGPKVIEQLKAASEEFEKDPQYDETDSRYCGWELNTMDQLSSIMTRLGPPLLHKIFKVKRDVPITTPEAFNEGIQTVAKGSKRPLILRESALRAIWNYLLQHCVNPQIGVTVDELFLAFSVRDFTSLRERREAYQELTSRLLGDADNAARRRYSFTFVGFGPTPPADFCSPAGGSISFSKPPQTPISRLPGIPGNVTPGAASFTGRSQTPQAAPMPVASHSQSHMHVSKTNSVIGTDDLGVGASLESDGARHSPDRSRGTASLKESPTVGTPRPPLV
jgi:diadenosine tetraphosphatase ApaH/serine/threonine PP2A family protein phosphatase